MQFRGLVNVVAQNATASARLASVAVAVAVVGLGFGGVGMGTGCSLVFSEAAPAGYETRTYFACGDSLAPPILDTVATGLFGLTTLQGPSNSMSMSASERRTSQVVTIGAAVLAAGSAVYGYTAVADCRAAERARLMAMARASWLPPPYGVPPYGAPPSTWPPILNPAPQPPPGPSPSLR
jgi:hypothetical protein